MRVNFHMQMWREKISGRVMPPLLLWMFGVPGGLCLILWLFFFRGN